MKHLGTILILAVLAWTGNEFTSFYNENQTLDEIYIGLDNDRYIDELDAANLPEMNQEYNFILDVEFLPMEVQLDEFELDLINLEYEEELENTQDPALDRPVLEEIELNIKNYQYEEELENA